MFIMAELLSRTLRAWRQGLTVSSHNLRAVHALVQDIIHCQDISVAYVQAATRDDGMSPVFAVDMCHLHAADEVEALW